MVKEVNRQERNNVKRNPKTFAWVKGNKKKTERGKRKDEGTPGRGRLELC